MSSLLLFVLYHLFSNNNSDTKEIQLNFSLFLQCCRFSLDLFSFQFILVLSRERCAQKGITYMKKLITIILALIMTFFSAPQKGADQTPVTAVNPPQTAITVQVEQVPEESETPAETAFVSEVAEAETTTKGTKDEALVVRETVTEDCTDVAEESVTKPKDETVECIDEGDQSLAEYKPQIGGQPNPFENDTSTEIDDRPVEDYIGEGEDRPGEGKHF